MVEERKIKKSRYFIAFVLTGSIFVIGVLIGLLINQQRTSFLEEENKIQNLNYDSIQLQYLYLSSLLDKEKDCGAAKKTLDSQVSNLNLLGSKLENFISDNTASVEEYNLIKHQYVLAELRYWFFVKNVKEICKDDIVNVLYFYSNINCEKCRTQGVILSKIKDDLKDNILIFSLDNDFVEEPLIEIIKSHYDIKSLPTLIINGEKHEGFYDDQEILKIVCPNYKKENSACKI